MSGGALVDHLREIRRVLRDRELAARKRLGQHFLLDARILRRIVAAAGDVQGRTVVEVGPGPGGLTAALLEAGARVEGMELDEGWADFAEHRLAETGRLRILREDARRQDGAVLNDHIGQLADRDGRPPLLVANLPYQVASPLLVDVLHAPVPPERLVVMVQKEVAARLVASAGSRERGLLTLLVEVQATARRRFAVPAGAFTPPPRVDSAVVELRPDPERRAELRRRPGLLAILRRAFQERRKMLRRSLRDALPEEAAATLGPGLLESRPEQLTREAWYRLMTVFPAPE